MEAEANTKKTPKQKLFAVIRYILAIAAGAAIGIGAEKLGVEDKEAVEQVKVVVTETIKGNEVTEEQKEAAKEAAKEVVKEAVKKQVEEKK